MFGVVCAKAVRVPVNMRSVAVVSVCNVVECEGVAVECVEVSMDSYRTEGQCVEGLRGSLGSGGCKGTRNG